MINITRRRRYDIMTVWLFRYSNTRSQRAISLTSFSHTDSLIVATRVHYEHCAYLLPIGRLTVTVIVDEYKIILYS